MVVRVVAVSRSSRHPCAPRALSAMKNSTIVAKVQARLLSCRSMSPACHLIHPVDGCRDAAKRPSGWNTGRRCINSRSAFSICVLDRAFPIGVLQDALTWSVPTKALPRSGSMPSNRCTAAGSLLQVFRRRTRQWLGQWGFRSAAGVGVRSAGLPHS